MHNLVKRFIVWYLLTYCNAVFRYKGRVARLFSEGFYDDEVMEYLNAVARARFRARFNERNGR